MPNQPLKGKVAIVTGAGSAIGFGRAMSLALLRVGARVAMFDIKEDALKQSAADALEVSSREAVLPIVGDVSSPEDVERAVQRTIAELGGLHVVVNNAGTNPVNVGLGPQYDHDFWDIPPEVWNKVVAVNMSGAFYMARAAMPHLLAQRWGRIIGITTSLDRMIGQRAAPYGPSKAGHEALIAVMAQDLEGTGVTAHAVTPGGQANTNLLTPEMRRERAGSLVQPDVMEALVVWLASQASNGINGRRFIARLWDESVPVEERLERASAPVAWSQLAQGAAAARSRG